jgi:hypothetical protein
MVYAWSNLWVLVVLGTASTLLPMAALCFLMAAVGPVSRRVLSASAGLVQAGSIAIAIVGIGTTAQSLVAMNAAAGLVSRTTASQLWERGWAMALLPAAASLGVAAVLLLIIRGAQALAGRNEHLRVA